MANRDNFEDDLDSDDMTEDGHYCCKYCPAKFSLQSDLER